MWRLPILYGILRYIESPEARFPVYGRGVVVVLEKKYCRKTGPALVGLNSCELGDSVEAVYARKTIRITFSPFSLCLCS